MVFVRDEHVDERSALDVGFCFAQRPGIKNGLEGIFLDGSFCLMNIFFARRPTGTSAQKP